MIHYTIFPESPEAHIYRINLRVPEPDANGQQFILPAWIPGSYMIRDFARNIVEIEAEQGGGRTTLEKLDKQNWRCGPGNGELILCYRVYAWDLSVRGAYLDTTRGFFNGTSVFLRAVGQETEPCRVSILPPKGERYRQWRVATTLKACGAGYRSFGQYSASNYEELIDHPVEMGNFGEISWEAGGVPHDMMISGRHSADYDRLSRDLGLICRQHIALFKELPEMERYLFMVFAVGEGYGGLEHRSSTALICKRDDLPSPSGQPVDEGYRQFLGLCSHEYFHLWNVKRIRPKVLKQADLSKEAHTRLLWAFEGITSYYDDLALVRSGCITLENYLELLAKQITREMRGTGRRKQTLSDSSFDAWTKFYKQDENAPNAIVSYYNKGALVALALDLTIREQTSNKYSLDDVMRCLWERYGRTDIGIDEDEVELIAAEVTGLPLGPFFDRYLRQTDELPLASLLESVGIGMNLYAASESSDQGGLRGESAHNDPPVCVLGANFTQQGHELKLTQVFDGGAAQSAGLAPGDTLIAVSGIKASDKNLGKLIAQVPAGNSVVVHAFRRDELMEFMMTAKPAQPNTCELWVIADADVDTKKHREAWLASVVT